MWNLWTHLIYKLLPSQIAKHVVTGAVSQKNAQVNRLQDELEKTRQQVQQWAQKAWQGPIVWNTKNLVLWMRLLFSCALQHLLFFCLTWDCEFQGYRLYKSASPPWKSRQALEVLFLRPRLSPPNAARPNHRLYNWSKNESKEVRSSFESKPCVRLPILALGREGELRTT